MNPELDVLILGGGPAAAAAAITLRRQSPGLRLYLAEGSDFRRQRAGECLHPQAGTLLRNLGLLEGFLATGPLPSWGNASRWGSDSLTENHFLFHSGQPGWHLDRNAFDAWLLAQAALAGAEVHTQTRVREIRRVETLTGWEVVVQDAAGERRELRARWLLDAGGRGCKLARSLGVPVHTVDQLCGLYGFAEASADTAHGDALIESAETGWWYSAGLPGGRCAFAWMTDAPLLQASGILDPAAFGAALRQTVVQKDRLLPGHGFTELHTYAAATQYMETAAGAGWIAAGDAASTLDPLSSQGMFKALRGGMMAAFALLNEFQAAGSGQRRYQRFLQQEFEEYLNLRQQFYAQESARRTHTFWQSRAPQVRLHPNTLLTVPETLPPEGALHSPVLRPVMQQLAGTTCTAADLAAQVRSQCQGLVSDARIIAALQCIKFQKDSVK